MRALMLGAALVLASASAVLAEDPAPAVTPAIAMPDPPLPTPDTMTPLFGNTIVVIDAKGLESHTFMAADGTFTGIAPAYNYKYQGKWFIAADGQLCRNFDPEPPGIVNPVCSPIESHAVGDKWTDKDGGSDTIVAGQN